MPLTPTQAAIEARAAPWPGGSSVETPTQVAQDAAGAGFRGNGLVTIVAIVGAESGGNAYARNFNPDGRNPAGQLDPRYNEDSRGLAQINIFAHPQYAGMLKDSYGAGLGSLDNPPANMAAALAISGGGVNFGAWSSFTSGAYKAHLAEARAAVQGGVATSYGGGVSSGGPGFGDAVGGTVSAGAQAAGSEVTKVVGGAIWNGIFGNISPGEFAIRALEVVGGGILMLGGLTLIVLTLAQAPVSSVRSGPVRGLVGRLTPTERGLRNVAGEQRSASIASSRARRMEAEDRIYRSSTARRRASEDEEIERRARADAPARAARNRRYRSADAVPNRRGSGSTRPLGGGTDDTYF